MYENQASNSKTKSVHKVSAHVYFVFFLFFLVGVCLDIVFNFKVLGSFAAMLSGLAFLALGTLFIAWAQQASRNFQKENMTHESFRRGPYRYTRNPTHWGVFLLLLGFGLAANAFFVIALAIVAFFVTKLIFLRQEEEILTEKYGAPYLEYKKSVKL